MDAKHIWRAALGELQVALSPASDQSQSISENCPRENVGMWQVWQAILAQWSSSLTALAVCQTSCGRSAATGS